jgi:hypothetical protein
MTDIDRVQKRWKDIRDWNNGRAIHFLNNDGERAVQLAKWYDSDIGLLLKEIEKLKKTDEKPQEVKLQEVKVKIGTRVEATVEPKIKSRKVFRSEMDID